MSVRRVSGEALEGSYSSDTMEQSETKITEITINGRYPDSGYELNQTGDIMIYVVSGWGVVVHDQTGFELHPHSAIQIDKDTPYYFEGSDLRILVTPPVA